MRRRLLPLLLIALLGTTGLADRPAAADVPEEEWLILMSRDPRGRDPFPVAYRAAAALEARDLPWQMILVGSSASVVIDRKILTSSEEETPLPSQDALLEKAKARPSPPVDGPDPRFALREALWQRMGAKRLRVLALGHFQALADEDSRNGRTARKALEGWSADAPEDVAVYVEQGSAPFEARGVQQPTWLVLALGAAEVEAQAIDPFASDEDTSRRATVRLPGTAISLHGTATEGSPAITLVGTNEEAGRVAAIETDEGWAWQVEVPDTTTSWRGRPTLAKGALLLTDDDSPSEVEVAWRQHIPAIRLDRESSSDGDTPAELLFGTPTTLSARVRKTTTYETAIDPRLTVRSGAGGTAIQPAPFGIQSRLGEFTLEEDGTLAAPLSIELKAERGRIGTWLVELRVAEQRITFTVVVPRGEVVLTASEDDEIIRLPRGERDRDAIEAQVESRHVNSPASIDIQVFGQPSLLATLDLHLHRADAQPVPLVNHRATVPVGTPFRIVPSVARGRAWHEIVPGELVVRPVKSELAEVSGRISARIDKRRPSLGISSEGSTPRFRQEGDGMVIVDPLVLLISGDGADPAFKDELSEDVPQIRDQEGRAWRAEHKVKGYFLVHPPEGLQAYKRETFASRVESARLSITWPYQDDPIVLDVPVEVPARWGAAGYGLLALALLALLLGFYSFRQMRPPPLSGMLLYTIAGAEGTVGRLKLDKLEKGRTRITSDKRGKLSVEGKGDLVVAIEPTRIGGAIYVPLGDDEERQMLVDGLTLRSGRHTIRFVSATSGDDKLELGAADAVPDLIGEEYDIASGRIEALEFPETEPIDPKN